MPAPLVALLAWLVYGTVGGWELLHDTTGVVVPSGWDLAASACLPLAVFADGRSTGRRSRPTARRWLNAMVAVVVLIIVIAAALRFAPWLAHVPAPGHAARLGLGVFGATFAARRLRERWWAAGGFAPGNGKSMEGTPPSDPPE